jgi:hypothetical protein
VSSDLATVRLGTYLAIGFTVQLVVHLLGVGVPGGRARIEFFHPFLIALSVLLARGVRPARTLLLVVTWIFGLLASFLLVIAATSLSVLGLLLCGVAFAVVTAQMVALCFTVPEAGVPGGVPERWRPWATSQWLHLTILLAGMVAAFTAA